MSRSTGSCAQRLDHVARCPSSRGSTARARRAAARIVGRRHRRERPQVEPGRDHVRLGHPADRVVGADDLRVGALAERELGGRLAADVGAEVVEDALLAKQRAGAGTAATSGSASARSRSGRCRSAAPAARRRRTAARAVCGNGPCRSSDQSASWMQLPALEDDEPRVDPLPPQRLHVLPRNPGDVDRAVRDPKPLWIVRHGFVSTSDTGKNRPCLKRPGNSACG